jgi:hypothetical protein
MEIDAIGTVSRPGEPAIHPVAALFPMMSEEELAELAADIAERGLLQPIVRDKEGLILDGRNRFAACEIAGVEPEYEEYRGDDPEGYALAVNITRRHLRPGARYIIMEEARRLVNGAGTETYRSLADTGESAAGKARLAEAAVVLDYARDLRDLVVAGDMGLGSAAEQARERKRAAREMQEKKKRLQVGAIDLYEKVEDGLDLDEALGAMQVREEKARAEAAAAENEAQRLEHERSVVRERDIQTARDAAEVIVTSFKTHVASLRIGYDQGATGLVTETMIAQVRDATKLLEELL